MRCFLTILINLICFTVLLGQATYSNRIFHTTIPPKDLTQCITQTPDGFYWFGNSSGLYRFDGQQSTHFVVNDPASKIQHDQFVSSKIFPDKRNIYWFTTYQALHALDPLTGKFSTFKVALNGREIDSGYVIFFFDAHREEILLKADTSLFAFDTRSHAPRLLLEHTDANEIYELQEGAVPKFYGAPWWNADGMEYFEYTSGAITNFTPLDLPVMVKHAAPYTSDSIFLATPAGLQLLTNATSIKDRNLETLIPGNARYVAISPDKKTVFVSISGQGIYAYDTKTNQVTANWNTTTDLSSDDARILTPDAKGNLFVSHLIEGVDVIAAEIKGAKFTESSGSSPLRDITTLRNGAILGIDEAGNLFTLDSLKESRWQSIPNASSTPAIQIARLGRAHDGSIHIHGKNGFASLDADGTSTYFSALPTSIYHGVLAFENSEVLVVNENGIFSIDKDQGLTEVSGLPNGPDNFFTNFIKLTEDRFLACYRQIELWDVVRDGKSWKVQFKNSLPGELQSAIKANELIYLGTSTGLFTYANDSISLVFNPTSTIGNLWINALHLDKKKRLWLGTEQGLFCYYPETGAHLYFSEADGLADDWFIRANVIADDSTFTMATKTGLVTIDTRLADASTSANKIYLSDVWINGIRKTDHSLYAPLPLDLDFQHNAVSFLPGMIELSSSSLSGFRYRLRGLEEAYTYSKAGEVIRYPSVPPGNYVFEFVGVDKNGRSTEPFTLPVTISPPFYQTWWFWTICGASLLALFYALNRRAVRQETARQQAIQKEEARKADEKLARHQAVVSEQRRIMMELHDDLGGTLGSLFYTLDGYLLDQESGLPVAPDLELLKNTSSDAMKKLREVMKNNVAREMPLPVFVRTLTELARATAMSSRLNWKLVKDDHFPEWQLNGQQVHNTLLIVKEALQNIRKHAKATSFIFKLHLEASSLAITLADNGVGIKTAETDQRTDGTGNGLANMQRRADDLGGTLTITSPPDGGTRLELRFPLKEPT